MMSLFICSKCGCVENTATGDYWNRPDEPLCSECSRGKWHNRFEKFIPTPEYLEENKECFVDLR